MRAAATQARVPRPSEGATLLRRACSCGGVPGFEGRCEQCRLRRLSGDGAAAGIAAAPPVVNRALASPGRPLEPAVRGSMERRFGSDFGRVRIHTDSTAGRSADAVEALAYTVGSDVVFGPGRYDPRTRPGLELLAHELAHVVQQDSARAASGPIELDTGPADGAEVEARSAAREAVAPSAAPARLRRRARRLQRSPGSPAGGCGVCFGSANLAGIEAHAVIEAAMRARYGAAIFTEFLIPSGTDDNARLDLMVPIPGGFAIGEIKPANAAGLFSGDLDLFWYEEQLRALDFTVTRLNLPPPLLSIPFIDPLAIGCPPQQLFLDPPVHGIYTYFCEPDFSVLRARCRCVPPPRRVPERERERVRERERRRIAEPETAPRLVPVPDPVGEAIRRFVREVARSGEDANEAARRFLEENRVVLQWIAAGLLIAAAAALVIATIVEDVLTAGVGVLDDPASFAAAAALVLIAVQMIEEEGGPAGVRPPEIL